MREGTIVFHGPLDALAPYFAEMGLPCPDDTDAADFYVEYLSDPEIVWARELKRLRAQFGDDSYMPPVVPPLSTEEMSLYFRASMHRGDWGIMSRVGSEGEAASLADPNEVRPPARLPHDVEKKASGTLSITCCDVTMTQERERGCVVVPESDGKDMTSQKSRKHMLDTVDIDSKSHILLIDNEDTKKILEEDYTLSDWQQFKLVFVREWKLLKRNKQFIGSHVFSDIFMGMIIGSLFFGLRRTSFQIRYGLFFLCTLDSLHPCSAVFL